MPDTERQAPPPFNELESEWEQLRKQLLDLTRRNSLISYRRKRRPLVFLNRDLDAVAGKFLTDEASVNLEPARPMPNRHREGVSGITAEDDLIEGEVEQEEYAIDVESMLQKTLVIDANPKLADSLLTKLYRSTTLALQETGANFLHLVIGFLEWRDREDSEQTCLSPLMLIPVTLERGKLDVKRRVYRYSLKYSDEDLVPNLSLSQKLKADHGIDLPEPYRLSEDDELVYIQPSEYLAEVRMAIKDLPDWQVLEELQLDLFSFSKQVMYLSLDSRKWPEGEGPKGGLVRRLLTAGSGGSGISGLFGEEHPIDGNAQAEEIPLVMDADSSQHSALIDVLSGKDLFIEGPPGTGKSQTIANLIAAALHSRKSVLFVAEKMAALEVVKGRLDQVGLGEFCLELHSHKTNKAKLLGDIQKRINLGHPASPLRINARKKELNSHKERLQEYVDVLKAPVGPKDETLHDVFWHVERLRQELGKPLVVHSSSAADQCNADFDNQYALCREYVAALRAVGDTETHAWSAFHINGMMPGDEEMVLAALQQALSCLQDELVQFSGLSETSGLHIDGAIGIATEWAQGLANATFPQEFFTDLVEGFKWVDIINELEGFIGEVRNLTVLTDSVTSACPSFFSLDEEACQRIDSGLITLGSISEVLQHTQDIRNSIHALSAAISQLEQIEVIGKRFEELLSCRADTLEAADSLATILNILTNASPDLFVDLPLHFMKPGIKAELDSLRLCYDNIGKRREELADVFLLEELPDITILLEIRQSYREHHQKIFRFLSSQYRSAKRRLKMVLQEPSQAAKPEIILKLDLLLRLRRDEEKLQENKKAKKLFGDFVDGYSTDWMHLEQLCLLGKALYDFRVSRSVVFKNKDRAEEITEFALNSAELLVGAIGAFHECREELSPILAERFKEQSSTGTLTFAAMSRLLSDAKSQMAEVLSVLEDYLPDVTSELAKLRKLTGIFTKTKLKHNALNQDPSMMALLGKYFEGVSTPTAKYLPQAQFERCLFEAGVPVELCEWVLSDNQASRWQLVRDTIAKAAHAEESFWKSIVSFSTFGSIRSEGEIASSSCVLPIQRFSEQLKRCLGAPDCLLSWSDYCAAETRLIDGNLGEYVKLISSGKLEAWTLPAVYQYNIYFEVVRRFFETHPELQRFNRLTHEEVLGEFRILDKNLQQLDAEAVAHMASNRRIPEGARYTKRVSELTDLQLIKHELSKSIRHIPIRQLVARAGDALHGLKPCFMMSPQSVAQFLQPGSIKFDLVVIDEASQVKCADGIGALCYAKQAVVVGDPKQLPPSSFFERIGDEEELAESVIEGAESVLDMGMATFEPRRLRWHYRSKHESLIAFSNREFYEEDLIVFPSPKGQSPKYGVKSHFVENATFKNGLNRKEAEAIVDAVVSHTISHTDQTLGVVAFNKKQAELIGDLVEQRMRESSRLGDALQRLGGEHASGEPFFVKNLENVQGDERDVMFISTTYGTDPDTGRVYNRFGPLTGQYGWRRFNVMITRSKIRMEVFTSMREEDIRVLASPSRGVRALRKFLHYAAHGTFPELVELSDREPDSPFEVSVAQIVSDMGFRCRPQVGVAGYFIDIGVMRPGTEGEFMLGIECDGASYHSSKSARDRDRLRQDILEALGWRIHRIWSVDWFKNREAEIERLAQVIESSVKNASNPKPPTVHTPKKTFSEMRMPESQTHIPFEPEDVAEDILLESPQRQAPGGSEMLLQVIECGCGAAVSVAPDDIGSHVVCSNCGDEFLIGSSEE